MLLFRSRNDPARARQQWLLACISLCFVRQCMAQFGSYLCLDLDNNNSTLMSGIFTDESGSDFGSPVDTSQYGLHYYNHVYCKYTFIVAAGRHVYVEWSLLTLDSTCEGDQVRLYLADSTIRVLCGHQQGWVYDIVEDNTAEFEFVSDGSGAEGSFTGVFIGFDPELSKRSPTTKPKALSNPRLREPEPSGVEPRHSAARSNAWLMTKRASTQYLHHYRYINRNTDKAALPLHNPTAMQDLLQTREAVEFKSNATATMERLERALEIRESFFQESFKVKIYMSMRNDIGRFCGTSCAKAVNDVYKICMDSHGF